jgi:hypothetical protein
MRNNEVHLGDAIQNAMKEMRLDEKLHENCVNCGDRFLNRLRAERCNNCIWREGTTKAGVNTLTRYDSKTNNIVEFGKTNGFYWVKRNCKFITIRLV